MSAVDRAQDVPGLLAALQASDPGRPRLTWYGADGERIELSARVLANWVSKTANLLQEELDAGPGTQVRLALPGHWKTVVLALAGWSVGADVTQAPAQEQDHATSPRDPAQAPVHDAADVLVTDRPQGPQAAGAPPGTVVAVALPSLARRFDAPLPAGVLDYAAEVAGFDDVFVPSAALDHAGLLGAARRTGVAPLSRLLVQAAAPDALDRVLQALVADGSVVLAARTLSAPEQATERLSG